VATSIAVRATLRSGTGSRPTPSRSRCVHASAAATLAMPLSQKQSSHSQLVQAGVVGRAGDGAQPLRG